MMGKASAKIAAGIVLAAARGIKERAEACIIDRRKTFFEKALKTPVRRGRLWWSYKHYRTEAECLAYYQEPRGWYGSREYEDTCRPKREIEWADEYTALAKASLSSGDGFVKLTAECVQFLGLERDAA